MLPAYRIDEERVRGSLQRGISAHLMSEWGQIRPYDDIPAMSGLITSGHPHVTTEGLKSARTGREQRQQHAVRGRQGYSITSSARSRNPGIVTPSALAVVRLMMRIELGRLP